MVDRAVGELVRLHARLGHHERLAALLAEIGDRPVTGPATELVKGGHDVLSVMRTDPKHLYLCGPTALKMLLLARHATIGQVQFLDKVRAGPRGMNLAEIATLAERAKLAYRAVFRKPGEPVPLPSIVHWRVGHFATIVGEARGRYEVKDPTLGPQSVWVTRAALDAEASGYFLAPADVARSVDWRTVAAGEAVKVWGAGSINGYAGNPAGGAGADPADGNPPNPCMCGYGINEQTVSLNLTDTPVGYRPPIGPSAKVTLGYDQRDQNQPANFGYFNVGPKWTLSWQSYVQDDPTSAGANVTRYTRSGALYSYTNYVSSTGDFDPQADDASILTLTSTSPIAYRRHLRDGSTEIYAKSDGSAVFPRHIFLTQVIDPQGNALILNYGTVNGDLRLASLTDAAGRSTTATRSA